MVSEPGTRLSLFFIIVCLTVCSAAQVSQTGGQIFLPNGSPLQKEVRFTLTYENGMRTETLVTDSNGRIQMTRVNGQYTITVETDGETYDTTAASFDSGYHGSYISIYLRPLKPKETAAAGASLGDAGSKINPQARDRYAAANRLSQAKEYEKAIEPLKQAILLEPNYFDAYNDLGVVYMKLSRLDEAAESFRQAIRINDKEHLPRLNLGIVFNKQKKYKESAEALAGIRRNDPTMSTARMLLIEARIETQDWVEAERELRNALVMRDDDQVDMKVKLGSVLIRQGKFDGAVGPLRDAVTVEPGNALAQFNLGTALMQIGKADEAETALRRAYELNGAGMAAAQLMLGQLYFQKGDYPKAILAFETYLRDLPQAPNAALVREAIQRLKQATGKP